MSRAPKRNSDLDRANQHAENRRQRKARIRRRVHEQRRYAKQRREVRMMLDLLPKVLS